MKEISRRKLLGTSLAGLASLPLLEALKTPDPTEIPTQRKPEIDYETLKSIDEAYTKLPIQSTNVDFHFGKYLVLYESCQPDEVSGFRVHCPTVSINYGTHTTPLSTWGWAPARIREINTGSGEVKRVIIPNDFAGFQEPLHTCRFNLNPAIFNLAIKEFETWLLEVVNNETHNWHLTDNSFLSWE